MPALFIPRFTAPRSMPATMRPMTRTATAPTTLRPHWVTNAVISLTTCAWSMFLTLLSPGRGWAKGYDFG